MNCIFCRTKTDNEPREHIIPEGLVGHQSFEIKLGSEIVEPSRFLIFDKGEVCNRCNNRLSKLDHYLQQQVGFLKTYWNPIGTKSGKPATSIRPGMFAIRKQEGPNITLNMEKYSIHNNDGFKVQPRGNSDLGVTVSNFNVVGNVANLTIRQPIRINKKFIRALHKIAFELLGFN
jgi:hypothetical protein